MACTSAMQRLLHSAKEASVGQRAVPFSVYASRKEQRVVNVPIIKPLLVCVLEGCKKLGDDIEVCCDTGEFIFLSNSPQVAIRNIPAAASYGALVIEFEFDDFACFSVALPSERSARFLQGNIDAVLQQALQQFVDWSAFAPVELWASRRREILQLLAYQGYTGVYSIMESPSLSHKLHQLMSADVAVEMSAESVASNLAMSESTLRRKLKSEGVSFQTIKDRARLGQGLHWLQTTDQPIGLIAEKCGYQSPSRFTDKFKRLFGITPSELRKTQMPELGE
ncbi:helix-turn-helix transcriptional regulator [Thiomicrorhabdus sp.]|uniref:helix-turn-helix transcriptional regulator n=1 Tax=Thiomicrorhabdus sp. TaxID=2039724 RepID=UPI0029C6EE6A|nr:helix-turn-helix transcriptional regulator [Thiomicrorhabdus sp.]